MSASVPAARLEELFSFLSAGERESLLPLLERRVCKAGELLLRTGDSADFMCFVVEGKLEVKRETTFPGKFVLLAVLERGSMVGEVGVVEGDRRNATVVVAEESQLLVLSRGNMEKLLAEHPVLGLSLLRRIIHVLGCRLRRASDRLSRLL